MSKITYKPGNYLADEYLILKAKQADLAALEKALKEAILKMGVDVIEGDVGRVTISHRDGSTSYDTAMLKALVPAMVLDKCAKVSKPSLCFNVKARVADAAIKAA